MQFVLNKLFAEVTVPNRMQFGPGAVEHEAEKDSIEFMQLLRAVSRPGDVVLDPFCGRARWIKEELDMRRNVIVGDIDSVWIEKIAQKNFRKMPV